MTQPDPETAADPHLTTNTDTDILIVGAGPTGLTAAAELVRAGHRVLLIEKALRVGGMAASVEVGGQRVDLGSHRIHPSSSAQVRALLQRLLGDDLQTRPRHGRIRLAGRWLGFPLQPVDLIRSTPLSFGLKAAIDLASQPLRRIYYRNRDDTYEQVVRVGLGSAVLANFYGPYAKKLWGCDANELAGEVARRRISITGPLALVKKLVSNTSDAPTFLYPRHGFGQIVDRLLSEVEESDLAELNLGTEVTAISTEEDLVNVTLGDGTSLTASRVFWTAPPQLLANLVDHSPSGLRAPVHRAVVLAYLVLDTPQYSEFDAHYLPGLDTRSARISEPKNYRDGPDPQGTTVLCAELACDVGDEVWSADLATLGEWVNNDLVDNGLPQPEILELHVERLPKVYPVITPADLEPQRTLDAWANSMDRIHTFGRQGLVVADNLHHVMDMAFHAVSCLGPAGQWDEQGWSDGLNAFASNTVED